MRILISVCLFLLVGCDQKKEEDDLADIFLLEDEQDPIDLESKALAQDDESKNEPYMFELGEGDSIE